MAPSAHPRPAAPEEHQAAARLPAPRPGIDGLQAYIGGESEAVANPRLGRPIRLASNEGALGMSPAAAAAYAAAGETLHRYPDGSAGALREAIAAVHRLDADRIVCGAGSDELIALLARAYAGPGDEVVHSAHGFLMYALAARGAGATAVSVPERRLTADVDAILAAVGPRTRLVFLANPNNPTGSLLAPEAVARLATALPDGVLLVVDAAYAEYLDDRDYEDGARLVAETGRVVMLRTFSKVFGLAALRLGWAYCPAAVADVLNRVRGPFNVTAAAQAAGVAAIADRDFVARARMHNAEWRAWTADGLSRLGLLVHPSAGNFVLVDFAGLAGADAASRAEAARLALKADGILVRQMGAYGLPGALRVSIGTAEEMVAVVDAFAAVLDRQA